MDLHTLYAMEINGTVISQIEEQGVDQGLNELIKSADGEVDPTYAAIMSADPRFRFKTSQIASFLGAVGIGGLPISSAVNLYLQKYTADGLRAGTLSHKKLAVTAGLVLPRRISVSQGGVAMLEFEIIPRSSDGLTTPLTWTSGVTLPTGGHVTEIFTLGPLKVNGSTYAGIQSFNFDFGISEKVQRHSGQVWPSFLAIESRNPSIGLQTDDAAIAQTLTDIGTPQGATDSVVYLRKVDRLGTRVADGTAQHISFTVDDGIWKPTGPSGSHGSHQTGGIECKPISDGTNPIVAISTSAAIS